MNDVAATPPAAPFVVAHRAGNDLASLQRAEALGVALIEADLRLWRGRVEVRHLKTLGPIPILWDRWRLGNPFARRLLLPELLDSAGAATTLLLDLKGRKVALSRLVVAALAERGHGSVLVCARSWPLLEPFRGLEGVRTIYSVGTARQLRALLRSRRRADGVAIHLRLLDRELVERLRRHADLVFTWPVNGLSRGRTALSLQVDGLISDEPSAVVPLLSPGGAG